LKLLSVIFTVWQTLRNCSNLNVIEFYCSIEAFAGRTKIRDWTQSATTDL